MRKSRVGEGRAVRTRWAVLASVLVVPLLAIPLSACGGGHHADAGMDATLGDASELDASSEDASELDASTLDAATVDASADGGTDAGTDAGPIPCTSDADCVAGAPICDLTRSVCVRCTGQLRWDRTFGGPSGDRAEGLAVGADDEAYVSGQFSGPASFGGGSRSGYYDPYLVSFAADGTYRWDRAVSGAGSTNVGAFEGLAVGPSGDVFAGGGFEGTLDFGNGARTSTAIGGWNILVASYGADGTPRWDRVVTDHDGHAIGVAADSTYVYAVGDYLQSVDFGGGARPASGASDLFAAAFDSTAGAFAWDRTDGSMGPDGLETVAVGGGHVVVGGEAGGVLPGGAPVSGNSDVYVASFTASGTLEWQQALGDLGGADAAIGVALDASGNVYVTGPFSGDASFGGSSHTSAGGRDGFLLCLGPDGTYRWDVTFGGTGDDFPLGITVAADGSSYVAGRFDGSTDFGGGTRTSAGGTDAFVVAFGPDGAYRWDRTFGSTGDDEGWRVATAASDDLYVTGSFQGTVDFGGGPRTSTGDADVFLLRVCGR